MKGEHLEQAGADLDYEGLHQASTLLVVAGERCFLRLFAVNKVVNTAPKQINSLDPV